MWQALECQNHIEEAIGSIYPVHAIVGRKCLEVMPRDISKASAAKTIVESLDSLPLSLRSGASTPMMVPGSGKASRRGSDNSVETHSAPLSISIPEQCPLDFVLCMGDDRSDEDMFQYVNGLKFSKDNNKDEDDKENGDNGQQHRIVTCTVGSKSSAARWFVPGVTSVLQGLQLMIDSASTTVPSSTCDSAPTADAQVTLQTAAAVLPKVMAVVE
jgi:trehalose 6-phosphate synthase/phosphatase